MGINSCGTTLIDQGVFKNIGAITWDTTVKTSGFTAVSGNGYFCNTTSAAFTVTLPSSPSAGDVVAIADYANTFDTNNVTIGRNGSNIQGSATDFKAEIEGLSITLIYVDGTQGWLSIDAAQASNIVTPQFTVATGGTITTSGDFKIHTFTGPGTFCVSVTGNSPIFPTGGPNNVDYLVVAGGGGGAGQFFNGSGGGGGAGAGGFRESSGAASGCYSASPLGSGVSALPVTATGYPITVGGGGAGGTGEPSTLGANGSNSVFSSITSAGGGGGNKFNRVGSNGGSGGSQGMKVNACGSNTAGSGNTPPVSPSQGNPGGPVGNFPNRGSAGGGGAGAAGPANPSGNDGTPGGAGVASSINASSVTRAGGGGGGGWNGASAGSGGSGGGGNGGSNNQEGFDGSANTGGGGGGPGPVNVGGSGCLAGGDGGSGIVIIRYKFQ